MSLEKAIANRASSVIFEMSKKESIRIDNNKYPTSEIYFQFRDICDVIEMTKQLVENICQKNNPEKTAEYVRNLLEIKHTVCGGVNERIADISIQILDNLQNT